ncbi:MAG: hypothetical protein EOO16_08825 [Chitinophagaceae bacterium]|nr:MAG: hypothetical protein EOO16_08825 [Chitinophagaceae bacterium]
MTKKELLSRVGIFPLGILIGYVVDKAFGEPFNASSVTGAIAIGLVMNLLVKFPRKEEKAERH